MPASNPASNDVAVFHPGVQHSWQTAFALQQLDRLNVYATSIFYQPDRWPYRIERYLPTSLAARAHAEFRRFDGPPLDPARIETFGIAEWLERIANRAGWKQTAGRLDRWGNRRFARDLRGVVERRQPAVLWGFNGSSRDVFADPANAGRLRILDRTIGDWRVYNAQMDAIHDQYADFFPSADYHIAPALIERDDEEYEAADVILTGSRFAARTVADAARDRAVAAKVRVLNYCYDEALFADLPPPRPRARARDQPVRFLFAGQANVRKGIHLVLDCFASVPMTAATLTIVGDLQVPPATFARYADRVKHRPTVARADVPALLADADVLLFPSYFEGAGLVLYEALASGCALIQSANAARAVTPATGLLLDELSTAALRDAVMAVIDDRTRLDGFRAAAQAEAQHYSFARYREAIAALLADHVR